MAECTHHQESRRPSAQAQGRLHLRRNGISPPQQQIERSSNAKPDYAPVKEDRDYILKYLLCFHKKTTAGWCKDTIYFRTRLGKFSGRTIESSRNPAYSPPSYQGHW